MSETAYELGAVLGTAVLGSILTAAYRAGVSLPAGLTDENAATARETLGGAVSVAESIGGPAGYRLLESARESFDSGVVLTSGIGVGLMALAIVLALVSLRRARS